MPLLGTAGVAFNGIPFFGPNEGGVPYPGFGDPVFNSIMHACMGHIPREYHYHALLEACLTTGAKAGEPSPILAFAVDGFPVYGAYGCADRECREITKFKSSWAQVRESETDAWDALRFEPRDGEEFLDRCNGHSGAEHGGAYHYHATETWPYILGCFSGTPSADAGAEAQPGVSRRGPVRGPPPDLPPSSEQVASAAEALGTSKEEIATALRLTGDRFAPMNFAASARKLGVEHNALR